MARSAAQRTEKLSSVFGLGGIDRHFFLPQRNHRQTLIGGKSAGGDFLFLQSWSLVGNFQKHFAAAIEPKDLDGMLAGFESDRSLFLGGRMRAVVDYHEGVRQVELRAIVRSGVERVVAIGRRGHEPGETKADVVRTFPRVEREMVDQT